MKKLLLAPVLFTVGFILNLYLGNITELSLPILVAPVGFGVVVTLIITIIFSFILKSNLKGTILSSVVVILFFTASGISPKMDKTIFLGLALLVIVALGVYLKRSKKDFLRVGKFLLVTSVAISLIALVRVGIAEIDKSKEEKVASKLTLPVVNSEAKNLPDIYYIVPDSYSASKNLLKYYNFDNSEFESFLTNKGFYIASESASNYPKTFLSLGSSLNMEYLDYLSKNKASKDLTLVNHLIEDNNVVTLLKQNGYKYYHLGSWWGATHTNRNATQNVILENESSVPISQFDYIVLKSTLFEPLMDRYLPNITVGDSDKDRMNRANYQFQKLSELASKPGPKFVFAHLIAPHEPYFYNRDCEFVPIEERRRTKEEVKYINHLVCVNKNLEKTVESILANSKTSPVIIIQSDEGAPFLAEKLSPPDSWGKASLDLLNEKFPVFNAYYFPDSNYDNLYPEITPVNSFRVVFNKYLGTDFPMLANKNYILPDLKHLYDFVDVTEKIN